MYLPFVETEESGEDLPTETIDTVVRMHKNWLSAYSDLSSTASLQLETQLCDIVSRLLNIFDLIYHIRGKPETFIIRYFSALPSGDNLVNNHIII